MYFVFFFKQKTAYGMRISDWISDVCSSDLDATLVFTFVGYANQEVAIQGRSTISVTMVEERSELNEVVVVGYGTQRRNDVTGSIVSVSAEEIEARPVNNVLEAMQGKAVGVDITSSQRPGTLGAITVRGVRSLSEANSPLDRKSTRLNS